ncbi:MAG: hypothetical protein ABIN36_11465 [Ferruginibacter sp.]
MRISLLFIISTLFVKSLTAQCIKTITKSGLEKEMFLYGFMGNDVYKFFVAKVNEVSDDVFVCKFLHSNSEYVFDHFKRSTYDKSMMQATVNMNKGGKYPKGTIFHFLSYISDQGGMCNLNNVEEIEFQECITTFADDGRSYLGSVTRNKGNYKITYYHTNSVYEFDTNWVIKKVTKGTYKIGGKARTEYAHTVEFK